MEKHENFKAQIRTERRRRDRGGSLVSCSLAHSTYLAPHISYGPATQVIVVVFVAVVISFFREVIYSYFDKGCRKNCVRDIPER